MLNLLIKNACSSRKDLTSIFNLLKQYNVAKVQKEIEKTYTFKSRRKNPDYDVDKLESLRSCLILNKADKNTTYLIKRVPKWITVLDVESVSTETGEILYDVYSTDDMIQAKGRKIKTIQKFCNYYEPLFKTRKVSLLFHTFTRINYSRDDMRSMLDAVKMRYKRLNRPIRGYLWVLEISETNHAHYHLIVAIDRLNVKTMPEALKFEGLWGQRTGVEFIKSSIRAYLSKYMYKSDGRLLKKRNYAISRTLK
jgi:hypothetical protein